MTLLRVEQVAKSFPGTEVLTNIDFRLEACESMALIGPSGSGKSTILHLVASFLRPDRGRIYFAGHDLASQSEAELANLRNAALGFVFQEHHLLPQLSALDNVLLPTLVGARQPDARARAVHLLERVGLQGRMDHRPAALSGGERQRVALVRALIRKPQLLLADEPTGALDGQNASALADLLIELNREEQIALLVVTHSLPIARRMQRSYELVDGALKELVSA
jgi:lipoprotein-releasing system ATP-binding protein